MNKYLLVIEVDRVGADGRYTTIKNQVVEGNPYEWFEQFKAEHDYESVNSWLRHTLLNWLLIPSHTPEPKEGVPCEHYIKAANGTMVSPAYAAKYGNRPVPSEGWRE